MTLTNRQKETIVIFGSWLLIFASTPLYMYYALLSIGQEFDWQELWVSWTYNLGFLMLFLINHYVLMPNLAIKKSIVKYIVCVLVALGLFVVFLITYGPKSRRFVPIGNDRENVVGPRDNYPNERPLEYGPGHLTRKGKPLPIAPPEMAKIIIAILMIGVDLGAAAWVNQQRMRQRLMLLEQQSLKQELEHLHFQLNPHFLMNTMNNIHVLVDLDQDRAKRAIVELSKMMRYSLYEGNGILAPLYKEMTFVRTYISLMKLRYADNVVVSIDIPEDIPSEIMVPPLMFITFVENAFKHGVSYREGSFIQVRLSLDEEKKQIKFCCVNSRHGNANKTEDGYHGIGLENVRKRLDLQYPNNYALIIDDHNSSQFSVELAMPFKLN